METFCNTLVTRLQTSAFNTFSDNHDQFRFGRAKEPGFFLGRNWSRRFVKRLGFFRRSWIAKPDARALSQWTALMPELEWFYKHLRSEESRKLLVDLVAYRILGKQAVRLPLSNKAHWEKMAELERLADSSDQLTVDFLNWTLSLHDLSPIGFPLRLYMRTPGVMTQFHLQQYCHPGLGVGVKPGDIVIDGGGCYGDTALKFAHEVGEDGHVFVFEFLAGNLDVARRNLEMNPDAARCIRIQENALWNASGEFLSFAANGPATSVTRANSTNADNRLRVETLTIDDLVSREALPRVDFIKMDIEGAEFNALQGAKHTIREFCPHLAICLYHSPEDFVRIPRLVDSWDLGYEFEIGHFTVHDEETVLFCKAPDQTPGRDT